MKDRSLIRSMRVKWTIPCAALGLFSLLVGCGGGHDHGEEHSHEDHAGHAHVHHAPHGGALVMLGDHAFQIELVPSPEKQALDLFVLDGGAERFVRIESEVIEAVGRVGERQVSLSFQAIADQATGEVVGSTSYFSVLGQGLEAESEFVLVLEKIEISGRVFREVMVRFPEGSH